MTIQEIITALKKLKENQTSTNLTDTETITLITKLLLNNSKDITIKEGCCSDTFNSLTKDYLLDDSQDIDINEIEKSLTEIQSKLERHDSEIENSKRTIKTLTTIQGELLSREESIKNQLVAKDNEIEDIKRQLREAQNITPIPADYHSLQLTKSQCDEIIRYLSEGRRLNINNYPNLNKSQLDEINKKNNWKNDKIKNLVDSLTVAQTESNNLRNQLTETQTQITDVRNQLNNRESELNNVNNELTSVKNELNKKESEIESINRNHQIEKTGLQNQIDTLQKDLNACQSKESNGLTKRITQLSNQLNQCNIKIPKLQAQIDKQKTTIDTQRSKIREFESKNTEFIANKEELTSVKNELDQKKIEITNKDNQIAACNREKDELQKNLTISNNNLNNVRSALQEKEEENNQNKNLANLYKSESDKFKKDNERLSEDNRSKDNRINQLTQEKSNLEKRIKLIDEIIADIPGAVEEGTTIELNQYENTELLSQEEKRIFESIDKDLESYTDQKDEFNNLRNQLTEKDKQLTDQKNECNTLRNQLTERDAQIREKDAQIAAKDEELNKRCKRPVPLPARPKPPRLKVIAKWEDEEKGTYLSAVTQLNECRELWKSNPIDQSQATGLLSTASGVGKNWADVLKYAHEIKRMENQLISDKTSRRVPHGRTVRWIGDNLNYLIDSLVRVTRPYIGDKESAYAYSAKLPDSSLNRIPDN